jgi:hypothetical protein
VLQQMQPTTGRTGTPDVLLACNTPQSALLNAPSQSNPPHRPGSWRKLIMRLSSEPNSSSDPLSCGFVLGFILCPQNKNRKISAFFSPKPCNCLIGASTRIADHMVLYLNG